MKNFDIIYSVKEEIEAIINRKVLMISFGADSINFASTVKDGYNNSEKVGTFIPASLKAEGDIYFYKTEIGDFIKEFHFIYGASHEVWNKNNLNKKEFLELYTAFSEMLLYESLISPTSNKIIEEASDMYYEADKIINGKSKKL